MLQSLLVTATNPQPPTGPNLDEPNIRLIYDNYMQTIFISESIITFNYFILHLAGLLSLPTLIMQAKWTFLSCEERIIWEFCMVCAAENSPQLVHLLVYLYVLFPSNLSRYWEGWERGRERELADMADI